MRVNGVAVETGSSAGDCVSGGDELVRLCCLTGDLEDDLASVPALTKPCSGVGGPVFLRALSSHVGWRTGLHLLESLFGVEWLLLADGLSPSDEEEEIELMDPLETLELIRRCSVDGWLKLG